jgi:hypothetical protein
MKIKLQDYSLISNEWIDEKLKYYNELIAEQGMYANDAILSRAGMLDEVKEQLIPSEKLADVSFNNGYHKGYNVGQKDFESHPLALTIANHIHQDRQEFLKSEIEILCKHQ